MEIAAKIRGEIGKNRIREAFALLEEAAMQNVNANDLMIALTTLKADYTSIERKQIIGTVTEKDEVRRREIIYQLLKLATELEKTPSSDVDKFAESKVKHVQKPEKPEVDLMDLIRIVLVSANPKDTFPLDLGEELKRIKQGINNGKYKDRFAEPDICHAAQFPDLIEALVRVRPHIVHFSGHGDDEGSVVLQDSAGESLPLSIEQTKSLFELVKSRAPLKSVVFNICHSAKQLESMSTVVEYVIGWEGAVVDNKALHFAENFYRTLANNVQNLDIEYAYEMGKMSAQVLVGMENGAVRLAGLK